eukprot:8646794-Alexandrium_andersonii.AAC.1
MRPATKSCYALRWQTGAGAQNPTDRCRGPSAHQTPNRCLPGLASDDLGAPMIQSSVLEALRE